MDILIELLYKTIALFREFVNEQGLFYRLFVGEKADYAVEEENVSQAYGNESIKEESLNPLKQVILISSIPRRFDVLELHKLAPLPSRNVDSRIYSLFLAHNKHVVKDMG